MQSKYISKNKLPKLVKNLKKKKKKIVFSNGCFDLLHPGHIKILRSAKEKGDILILGINSDKSISRIKGRSRPILNQASRLEVLSAIECIDYITVFCQNTPLKTIETVKPDILVKGADWKKKDIIGADFVKNNGGKVVSIALKKGVSTSRIIKRIRKNG